MNTYTDEAAQAVDFNGLQKIFNSINEAAQVSTAIVDPDNQIVMKTERFDELYAGLGSPVIIDVCEKEVYIIGKWIKYICKEIQWIDGRVGHTITLVDITDTKQMHEQLEQLAYFDRELRLGNDMKLQHDLKNADSMISLICFDIASLRKINDVYGWDIGDELLLAIKNWVLELNIPDSNLYRVGGDEFCLALENISKSSLERLAKKIYKRFSKPWELIFETHELLLFCDVYIGILLHEQIKHDGSLLVMVERVLDAAKKRASLVIYDKKTDLEYKQRLQLELNLKNCIKEGMKGFDVYYQPIVDPMTGTWCGLEALCRWTSPEIGEVRPSIFIPEAERQGLIMKLGEWVLERAVKTCKRLKLDLFNNFFLDVNLSSIQFLDEKLVHNIIKTLDTYDFPGEKLCLEITESFEFNLDKQSMDAVNALIAKKIQVSVDDFGTGYSSFHHLKNLPVHILKTERDFIVDINNNTYLQYLFFVIVELAHVANMRLIAEGVETVEQMDILIQSGVDYMQGYLFGKPMPAIELEQKLNNFDSENEYINKLKSRKINLSELLNIDSSYKLSAYLHQILNKCMRILFYNLDESEAIDQILEIIGVEIGVSRSYIFMHDDGGYYSNTHEWCAPGIGAEKESLQHVEVSKNWINLLNDDGIILAKDIAELPEDIYNFLKLQDIMSIAVIPLWDDDLLLGFVGFDDNMHYREWRPEEILMLHQICMIVATILKKHDLREEVKTQKISMEDILNNMSMLVYVSDLYTGEVLFENKHTIESFGDVKEQKCWKVFQNKNEKCEFCKKQALIDDPSHRQIEWEHFNPVLNKLFKIYDSIIVWDNKKAHMQYAIDMTEIKDYQKKLEEYAGIHQEQ